MELPQMKYRGNSSQIQTVQFKGLNRRPEPADGEYSGCQNLTTRAFPRLAPRKARAAAEKPGNPTAIFGWDKLVVVADGKLYLENEEICKVSDAPKQFAVVNSKLIVWPDKLQIDLTNNEILEMSSEFYEDPSPLFTANSIQISSLPMVEREYGMQGYKAEVGGTAPWINSFGYDAEKLFWDEETGWTSDGTTPLTPNLVSPIHGESAGAIFIPKITVKSDGSYTYAVPAEDWNYNKPSAPLSRAEENQMGIFGILQKQPEYGYGISVKAIASFYQAGPAGVKRIALQPGDRVEISGSPIQANNQKAIRIAGILKGTAPDYTDILKFENDPFLTPTEYVTLTEGYPAEKLVTDVVDHDSSSHRYFCTVTLPRAVLAGEQLLMFEKSFTWNGASFEVAEDSREFYLYDRANKTLVALASGSIADDNFDAFDLSFKAYSRETAALQVILPIPELDYICEKDNRLWGVSNKADNEVYDPQTGEYRHYTSRVLYASALGLPHRFFDFDGTAADSYQVAVASEGDFTGIIGYSDSVVAMKEDKVYRVFGDDPAAYQLYEYTIPGCAKGSHASLQIIGEILYYAGRNGIYAYDGSAPHLMSYPLGDATYENAVAGTDGVRYYLSVKEGETWNLFVYDTVHGIWTREDETQAVGFALVDGTLYLAAGNKIYKLEQEDGSETVQWSARFEALKEGTLQRKRWKWLRLRICLEDGAWMKVYYTPDNGEKTLAEQLSGAGTYTVSLPLTPMRCDRLTIDLEAQGRGQVQAMERAFYLGSKVY